MSDRIVSVLLLILLLPVPVRAAECPATGADATIAVIRSAGSCAAAAATYSACTWGSSMDVQLGQPVIEKCEAEFKAKLSKPQRGAYQRGQDRCRRKYAKRSGTLYISMAMSCAVDVAATFARRFGAH
jgi:hypothetical protein